MPKYKKTRPRAPTCEDIIPQSHMQTLVCKHSEGTNLGCPEALGDVDPGLPVPDVADRLRVHAEPAGRGQTLSTVS